MMAYIGTMPPWNRPNSAEIAAIGDDVDLRHRHGDAAGQAGEAQHGLQRVGRNAQAALRAGAQRAHRFGLLHRRAATQCQQERQRRKAAEHADADMRCAPAVAGDEMMQDGRPDGATEIVTAGHDGDGNAAPAREPLRGVRDQRPERRGRADTDHDVQQRKRDQVGSKPCADVADTQGKLAAHHGRQDAQPIGQSSHRHAPERKAHHGERERQ
jgi:hypothetical protein